MFQHIPGRVITTDLQQRSKRLHSKIVTIN